MCFFILLEDSSPQVEDLWFFRKSLLERDLLDPRRKFLSGVGLNILLISGQSWRKPRSFEATFLWRFLKDGIWHIWVKKKHFMENIHYFQEYRRGSFICLDELKFSSGIPRMKLFWVLKLHWIFGCIFGEKQLHYFPHNKFLIPSKLSHVLH